MHTRCSGPPRRGLRDSLHPRRRSSGQGLGLPRRWAVTLDDGRLVFADDSDIETPKVALRRGTARSVTENNELHPVSPGQPTVLPRHEPGGNLAARAEATLDVPLAAVVLDGLGVLALFATVAAVSGVREGAVVTSTVGVDRLTGRMLRARRARRQSATLGQQPS